MRSRFHPSSHTFAARRVGLLVGLLACCAASAPALAQPEALWPSRPITFVVPFGPGTATDVIARAIAEPMARTLKTSVVVENRPGANASIGASGVAKAKPDGYTVLLGSSTTHAANAALFHKLSYDPIVDFTPITLLGEVPQVMVVGPAVPARTVAEFMAYARSQPGKISYGQGSSGNLLPAAILNRRQALGMDVVAYRSPPQALVDVMGGHVPLMFADISLSLTNIRAGKLRALAVTSLTRSPLLPDVPPLADTLPGFQLTSWIAMWAPAATPAPLVQKLNQAAHAAMRDKDVAAKLLATGFTLQTSTPQDLGLLVAKETVKWAKFVTEAGVERQ
ncbi:MAG: tripartite tricarboxylate transporter substrate binding protein [Chitinophagaceae bacterium]|nr:tripartite tricarboxylate transporter substrate binding protein [Rubrivivax sp.]